MTEVVTINSNPFDTYATVDQADLYLSANFSITVWPTLSVDQKAQLIVTATRIIDRQCWLGTRTDDAQPLEWPRKGTGVDGVVDTDVPIGIINGSIELASAIAEGSSAETNPTPGVQAIQSLKAGSVNISYFRGAEGVLQYDRFPLPVQELVGKYSCGSAPIGNGGAVATGTGGKSETKKKFGYNWGV